MNLYLADAIEISTLYLMLPLIALAFYLFTASAFKDTESLPVEVSGLTITLSFWTVILPRFKLEGFSTMADSYIYILQNWITNLFF
jgi:hypothetical protein